MEQSAICIGAHLKQSYHAVLLSHDLIMLHALVSSEHLLHYLHYIIIDLLEQKWVCFSLSIQFWLKCIKQILANTALFIFCPSVVSTFIVQSFYF